MTTLYEQDYGLWAGQMADLITTGCSNELDIENLVEELCDLSLLNTGHFSDLDIMILKIC